MNQILGVKALFFLTLVFLVKASLADEKPIPGTLARPMELNPTARYEETCMAMKLKSGAYDEWLNGELKKAGSDLKNLSLEIFKTGKWDGIVEFFKIDGQESPAEWVYGSMGTYGKIQGHPTEIAEQPRVLNASVVDVGTGSLQDLASHTDLEGKIWLVEEKGLTKDVRITAFEAQLRKAQGVIIFHDKEKYHSRFSGSLVATLPMIHIDPSTARLIKNKLKKEPKEHVEVSLSIRTLFPSRDDYYRVLFNSNVTKTKLLLLVSPENCHEIAGLLEFLQWLGSSKLSIESTAFVIAPDKEEVLRRYPYWNADQIREVNFEGLSKKWSKLDHRLISSKTQNSYSIKYLKLIHSLKGIVDGASLGHFQEDLKENGPTGKGDHLPELSFESLTPLISDLKTLQEIHREVERGLWSQARANCKNLTGFESAELVSPDTFVNYINSSKDIIRVNPKVWVLLEGGKDNFQPLLELIEGEIDRLNQTVTERFLALKKEWIVE